MVGRDTPTFAPILLLATSRVKKFFALSLARNLIKKKGLKNSIDSSTQVALLFLKSCHQRTIGLAIAMDE